MNDGGLFSFREIIWTQSYARPQGSPERWMSPEFYRSSEPSFGADSFSFGFVCIEVGCVGSDYECCHINGIPALHR